MTLASCLKATKFVLIFSHLNAYIFKPKFPTIKLTGRGNGNVSYLWLTDRAPTFQTLFVTIATSMIRTHLGISNIDCEGKGADLSIVRPRVRVGSGWVTVGGREKESGVIGATMQIYFKGIAPLRDLTQPKNLKIKRKPKRQLWHLKILNRTLFPHRVLQ